MLRPFNTYGPRQSARAVIPAIITQIASGSKQIKLGSLTPTRDFTFVKDTAEGFIQIMDCDAALGEVVNVGSSFEISIGDTVKAIAEAMGADIDVACDQERLRPEASEVERLFAGTEKAKALFQWAPRHAGYEGFIKGLAETAVWFQDPQNLSAYKSDRYVT